MVYWIMKLQIFLLIVLASIYTSYNYYTNASAIRMGSEKTCFENLKAKVIVNISAAVEDPCFERLKASANIKKISAFENYVNNTSKQLQEKISQISATLNDKEDNINSLKQKTDAINRASVDLIEKYRNLKDNIEMTISKIFELGDAITPKNTSLLEKELYGIFKPYENAYKLFQQTLASLDNEYYSLKNRHNYLKNKYEKEVIVPGLKDIKAQENYLIKRIEALEKGFDRLIKKSAKMLAKLNSEILKSRTGGEKTYYEDLKNRFLELYQKEYEELHQEQLNLQRIYESIFLKL